MAAAVMFAVDLGGSDGGAPPTPTSTPTLARSGLPDAVEIEVGGPLAVPFEVAVIDSALRRTYRNAAGDTVTEALLDPATLPGPVVTFRNNGFLGPSLPPGQFAVTVCTSGECPGLDYPSADARVSVYRSTDGGITWDVSDELDGVYQIASALDIDHLLLARWPREGEPDTQRYEWWPGGEQVKPPAGLEANRQPQVLPDGRIAWWALGGRLVDGEGRAIVDLADQLGPGGAAVGLQALPNADGSRLAVTWQASDTSDAAEHWYWSIYDRQAGVFTLVATYQAPQAAILSAWLNSQELLTNLDLQALPGATDATPRRLPALLFLEGRAALYGLSLGDADEGAGLGKLWAVAAQVGPFAYVDAGAGDCLNLRREPSLDAPRLDCLADGVLAVRRSEDEAGWTRIRAPSGDDGWASSEYLVALTDQTLLSMDDLMGRVYRAVRLAAGWTPDCSGGGSCLYVQDFVQNVDSALMSCARASPAEYRNIEGYVPGLHEARIAASEQACDVLSTARSALGDPADAEPWREAVRDAGDLLEPYYGLAGDLLPPP